ncbi:MAG: thiol reductant ABC exporter subunit CydC [Propioniciclava sp.]
MTLLRRLFGGISQPWLRLAGAVLLAALASGSSVALMATSAWLLSRAAEHPPVMYLTAAAVLVRAFGISRGVTRYVERLLGHDLGLRLQSALRLDTYRTLARTTLLGRRRGDLLTRVVADTEAVLDLLVRVLVPLASGVFVILATTIAFAVFSPAAAAVLLLTALVAGIGAPWLAARLSARADGSALAARGALADVVHETSEASVDLVAYGATGAALARVAAADTRLRDADAQAAWTRGLGSAVQVLAAGVAVMACFQVGASAVASGALDRTMLAVLALTPLALHEVFADFTKAAQTFTRSAAALDRIETVLDTPPIGQGDLAAGTVAVRPSLEVRGLTVGWPDAEPVLSDLNFPIAPSERVAVVGESGIGKTTLAATLLGLIPPVSGTVEVQGRIGYLAQDAHVFSTTVAENVRIGRREATDADVLDALTRVRLDVDPVRRVGELGTAMSGGEQRRLGLARLAVGDFQVLILDEPTEHLDPATADALMEDIWASTSAAPLLVVTHDPTVMARCDRILNLQAHRPATALR